jgi:hypothetical protein
MRLGFVMLIEKILADGRVGGWFISVSLAAADSCRALH